MKIAIVVNMDNIIGLNKFLEECGNINKPVLSNGVINIKGITKEEKERIKYEFFEETDRVNCEDK